MRCKHCHTDSEEQFLSSIFEETLEDLDSVGNRIEEGEFSEEELADALYVKADALHQSDDDDDEDDDGGWNGEYVSGPFSLSNLEAVVYHYPDGSIETFENPDYYYVTETGDHLLEVEDGEIGIVVTAGWRKIERFPRYGEKPFNIK